MTGNFLLAFFIFMPAVVMMVKHKDMRHSFARNAMKWGGFAAVVLAAMVILPLLACEGSMISGYTSCLGGNGTSALVVKAQPLIVIAAKLYVLAGIPLALVVYALDRSLKP